MALEQALHDREGFCPRRRKAFAIMGKPGNAAGPPALSGNRNFQDPETSRLADRGPSG